MALGVLHARRVRVVLVAAVVAAATIPLAPAPAGSAGAVSIRGPRTITESVEVTFEAGQPPATDVHLLAYNDFHGNLEPAGSIYGKYAGGGAYLAKAVLDRQALYGDRQATVMAGDNIGGSPLANGLFFEEPATIVTNLMKVDYGSVGNHEFDKGKDELLRIQNGGCHPDEGCTAAPYALAGGGTTDVFPGADFDYLSANVIVDATGEPLFPAFAVKEFPSAHSSRRIPVGFIGAVLEATPTIVTPTGVAGLTFQDEADAANRAVRQLREGGVKTFVLVIHQGGFQAGTPTLDGCAGNLAGSDILGIAERLDPDVKVIVSGHTHAEYRCVITTSDGTQRLITSASSFGRILSDITLRIGNNGKLQSATATNVIVENSSNPDTTTPRVPDPTKADPAVQAVVDQYVAAAAPLANQVIGTITAPITKVPTALGEFAAGDLIADAQRAATAPVGFGEAVVAFMNPGGVRGTDGFVFDAPAGSPTAEVTYGEAFTIQPFGNSLVTKTMTGAQIRAVLEQQFAGCRGQTTTRILLPSDGFTYQRRAGVPATAADCASWIGEITVDGTVVANDATPYRVTMNSFLAPGGDGFTVFAEGTDPLGGEIDIDALVTYFEGNSPLSPPPLTRISELV